MNLLRTYTPGRPSLEQLLRRIDDISTLPQVALRVMQVASDPNSSAADLKEVMECDAALSARVLRCVNSSAYALRTKITNLQQAIAYLGLKQIRNLAMTASVSELFKKEQQIGSYSRTGLWRHLVSVGICARMIAMRRKMTAFEDAFLGGLLHDIGIILLDQYAHQGFREVVAQLRPEETLIETERRIFGFDHTALGEKVAEGWKFPEELRQMIRWHHQTVACKGEVALLVACVEMANVICTLKGITAMGKNLVRFCPAAVATLQLSREDIAVLAEDLDREVEKSTGLFQL
jgi:putative nucleotidyltransferase with HDIG domain